MPPRSLKRTIHDQLEPGGGRLSWANRALIALVAVSVLAAILETEAPIREAHAGLFDALEIVVVVVFSVEYGLRLWTCTESPRFSHPVLGRLRYALTPSALTDLVAIAPALLTGLGVEMFTVRLVRVLRILRLAKLGRFSRALRILAGAVGERRYELGLSAMAALLVLLTSSTLLYLAEAGIQPEAFGSIPRAMWWSVATLTTVGYGDVYPVTAIGRVFAAITALAGIGVIAIPTGILAAAFSEALQAGRNERRGRRPSERL